MSTTDITWDEAFCSEGANCFRFGRDADGMAYIGTTDSAEYVTDSIDALRALVSAVKAGRAAHLLA
jgi:radical SAM superfamily enzyme with C-terminal helix-hairpin-helix motif